jgi:hypothetical protein
MERKGSTWIRFLPVIVVAVAILLALAWMNRDAWLGGTDDSVSPESAAGPPAAGVLEAGPSMTDLEQAWVTATGSPPVWPLDLQSPSDCADAVAELKSLAGRLDRRGYVTDWELPDGVYGLLTGSARDLGDNRPQVVGELARLDSVLANVSHAYLVLGRQRLERILRLIHEEPEMVEPMAIALFRWLRVRDRCGDPMDRGPGVDAQYEYAAFALNSLGGQAYLRRRPARIEALAGFYALLILDRSIEDGYNPYGLDPGREIRRYSQMLTGQQLLFRERYREILEDVQSHPTAGGG